MIDLSRIIAIIALYMLIIVAIYRLGQQKNEVMRSSVSKIALSAILISAHMLLKVTGIFSEASILFQSTALIAQEYGVVIGYIAIQQMNRNKIYQEIISHKAFLLVVIPSIIVFILRYVSNQRLSFSDNEIEVISLSYFISSFLHYSIILIMIILITFEHYKSINTRMKTVWTIIEGMTVVSNIALCFGVFSIILNLVISYNIQRLYSTTLNDVYQYTKSIYGFTVLIVLLGSHYIKKVSYKLDVIIEKKRLNDEKMLRYIHSIMVNLVPDILDDSEENYNKKKIGVILLQIIDADEIISTQRYSINLSPREYAAHILSYIHNNNVFDVVGPFPLPKRKNNRRYFISVAKHLQNMGIKDAQISRDHITNLPSNYSNDGIGTPI